MSELPEGWVEVRVGDVAASLVDGPFGSNLKTEHYTQQGVRVIRLQNIGDGRFDDRDKAFISDNRYQLLRGHDAKPGDVLIAALGDVLPRVCMLPPQLGTAIVKADCFRLRPNDLVDSKYLMFALQSPQMRAAAAPQIAGVGRPRLNLRKVRNLPLPLAPRAQQERIVVAIEAAFERIDRGVAGLGRAYSSTDGAVTALMNEAVNGWDAVPLREIVLTLRNGVFVSRPGTTPTERRIMRISAVRPMRLDDTDYRFVPDGKVIPNESAFRLRQDDLLFIRYNGNAELVGVCARVTAGAVGDLYPDKLIRAVVDTGRASPAYLEIALNCGVSLRAIRERRKTTAGQVGIAGSQLLEVPVPLPTLDVQNDVAGRVHSLIETMNTVRASIERTRVQVHALRTAVLSRAFSGQLVAQDPRDEDASVLLNRITQESTLPNGRAPLSMRKTRTSRQEANR